MPDAISNTSPNPTPDSEDNSGFIDKDELAQAAKIMKQDIFLTVFEELGLTSNQIDEYMEHWQVGGTGRLQLVRGRIRVGQNSFLARLELE